MQADGGGGSLFVLQLKRGTTVPWKSSKHLIATQSDLRLTRWLESTRL